MTINLARFPCLSWARGRASARDRDQIRIRHRANWTSNRLRRPGSAAAQAQTAATASVCLTRHPRHRFRIHRDVRRSQPPRNYHTCRNNRAYADRRYGSVAANKASSFDTSPCPPRARAQRTCTIRICVQASSRHPVWPSVDARSDLIRFAERATSIIVKPAGLERVGHAGWSRSAGIAAGV